VLSCRPPALSYSNFSETKYIPVVQFLRPLFIGPANQIIRWLRYFTSRTTESWCFFQQPTG